MTSHLRTLFLARVPASFLLVVGLLAVMSLAGPLKPTFVGLFTIPLGFGLFLVGLAVTMVSLGANSSINLITEHGRERTSFTAAIPHTIKPFHPSFPLYAVCQVPAIAFLLCCVYYSDSRLASAALFLSGWLAAHGLLAIGIAVEILLVSPQSPFPNMLVLPIPRLLMPAADSLHRKDFLPFLCRAAERFSNLLANYGLTLLPGYIYGTPGAYMLYPGSVFNTVFALIGFALWRFTIHQVSVGHPPVSALAFVLLAIFVLLLLLSGLAFFLDRFRIPVTLVVLGYVGIVGATPETDHLYRVRKLSHRVPSSPFASPADVMRQHQDRPIIVVTAGGGIQAAAWTAQVLAGIEAATEGKSNKHLALISSVSGGSVGAYFAASSWRQNLNRAKPLAEAPKWAATSAVDQVAWGWMGPDLMRSFIPSTWKPEIDRGWALEKAWQTNAHETPPFYLDDLAAMTRGKQAPAFIMNATDIEDGSPFVFASTTIPMAQSGQCPDFSGSPDSKATNGCLRRLKVFNSQTNDHERILLATAARLSASFPYISPAARSNAHPLSPDYHIVDGGYYDDFGIRSALDWLEAAEQEDPNTKPGEIALVVIRWGDDHEQGGSLRGWGFQSWAPLLGVVNVHEKEQYREDEVALRSYFNQRHIGVKVYNFSYGGTGHNEGGCDEQPLSWGLTKAQQACITSAWNSDFIKEATNLNREFLQ